MNQISEAVKGLEVEELTIAYDRQGCHVYDGNEFTLILEAENEDLSKDIILNYVDNSISTTDMLVHTDLGYTPRRQSRPQNLWMCSVNYVTQQPYEYICWAASIACITNYIRGTSYTAVEIAQDCLGSNFNQKLGFPAITDLLNEYLDDAAYYTGAENLFDSHIMGNLSQGYPLLGVFYSEWGSHAVTIYRYYSVDYGTIWIRKLEGVKTNNMHQKRYKRIRWFCGSAVLLSLCVVLLFTDRHVTVQPFEDLKSEEIKSVQVVNGMFGVIHDMTEVEIEELVDILIHVTHNEYARDFEIPVGGGLGERFILEFHDGRTISVGGIEVWRDGCYIAIDLEPYHDWDGTYSRQLSSLHAEYYRKWREGQER